MFHTYSRRILVGSVHLPGSISRYVLLVDYISVAVYFLVIRYIAIAARSVGFRSIGLAPILVYGVIVWGLAIAIPTIRFCTLLIRSCVTVGRLAISRFLGTVRCIGSGLITLPPILVDCVPVLPCIHILACTVHGISGTRILVFHGIFPTVECITCIFPIRLPGYLAPRICLITLVILWYPKAAIIFFLLCGA